MPEPMQRMLRLRSGAGCADVLILIHWPEPRENSWFADWSIGWPDGERKGSAGGEDAISALLGALKLVGTELHCSAEHEAGQLD
jgi:hypothetical protein